MRDNGISSVQLNHFTISHPVVKMQVEQNLSLILVILTLACTIPLMASPVPIQSKSSSESRIGDKYKLWYEPQPPFYYMPMGAPVFKIWHPHGYFNGCPFVRPLPLDPVWNQGCRPLIPPQPLGIPKPPKNLTQSTPPPTDHPPPQTTPKILDQFQYDDEEQDEDNQDEDDYEGHNNQYDSDNDDHDNYEKYSK